MRKWVKNTIWYAATLIGLWAAVFYAIYSFFSSFPDMCGNKISQEVYSPSHKYKAVIFQRDCGATTGFSTNVSIVGSNQILENKGGNAYVADNHPSETKLQLKWGAEQSLEIGNSDPNAFMKRIEVEGVSIKYK